MENDLKFMFAEAIKITPESVIFWHALRFNRWSPCNNSDHFWVHMKQYFLIIEVNWKPDEHKHMKLSWS